MSRWVRLLGAVWCQQIRWIQYGRVVHPEPQHVSRSLVQGDALSCLALVLLPSAPNKSITQETAAGSLLMTTCIDDRAGAARTAETAAHMIVSWRRLVGKTRLD